MSFSSEPQPEPVRPRAGDVDPGVIETVARTLAALRYGVVQLTVHDGRVVQLDVTERRRFS